MQGLLIKFIIPCNIAMLSSKTFQMLNLTAFHSFIKQHALLAPHEKVLLAVSGGRDSVLMAHYFKQAGFDFGIAHCNFKLREQEADEEEIFTSNLADELEVPFFVTFFDTAEYAAEKGISIQMAARDLRYQWLEEIRADFGYSYIALAHHQNDAAETILLNLTRGTGVAGLHGIKPKRDKLIRPLLFLTRNEIDEIVKTEKLVYRDDSSNSSTKYARNKIRLEVVPVLKELNPQLEETFKANARRFSELEIILRQRIDELKNTLFIEKSDSEIEISINDLKNLNPINTLLFGLFSPFGFTEAVLHDLVNNFDGQPGKMFQSPSHQIITDRGRLILSPKHRPSTPSHLISEHENEFTWNNESYKSYTLPLSGYKIKTSNNIVQLEYKKLIFPLKLRSWHKGDYFYPLGMKGKKKLSDYFIEQKIPRQRKDGIGVLENGNGDIVWISGYRSDERYKIRPETEKIFILEKQIQQRHITENQAITE